jgi:hypothetical protein
MESIPQEILFRALGSAREDSPADFLRNVANDFRDRADKEKALKRKAWQSRSKELETVSGHIASYADQLAQFAVNNPDGVSLVGDDETRFEDPRDTTGGETDQPAPKGKAAKPHLPGNTGRCASFRRATPEDHYVCELDRGHTGDHAALVAGESDISWPRTPSGHVCGDVVILHDGTALNCARPLGHDGDEHHDGRYQFWPRGVGTSRNVRICDDCNRDAHICHGCGEPIGHYAGDCGKGCTDDPAPVRVLNNVTIHSVSLVTNPLPGQEIISVTPVPETSGTVPPCGDLQPGIATALGTSCMLPKRHTGKHIGHTGARWEQVPMTTIVEASGSLAHVTHPAGSTVTVTPGPDGDYIGVTMTMSGGATLGEQADQMRATMIPGPRTEVTAEMTAGRGGVLDNRPPAAVMVAEMKEEVSATVEGLSNPFAAPQQGIPIDPNDPSHGGPTFGPLAPSVGGTPLMHGALSIVGSTEPERPITLSEFLPPHLVPGSPRERYSVSSVDAMADCGLKFRMKYRDGVAATNISWAGVGGKAFHEVVRTIEAQHANAYGANAPAPWGVETPLLEQERGAAVIWKQCFADAIAQEEESSGVPSAQWRATNGGKEGRDWWLHSGEEMVRGYIRWRPGFLAEGWTLLRQPNGETAQEIEFDVSVAGVMNKGFIDAAWVNVDKGVIRVVDYKSGTSDNKPFQLKTYGNALRALGALGNYRVEGAFYDARKASWAGEPLVLSADDDAEVEYRFQSTAAADRAGIFLARPSSYCGGCEVKASCPIMAKRG